MRDHHPPFLSPPAAAPSASLAETDIDKKALLGLGKTQQQSNAWVSRQPQWNWGNTTTTNTIGGVISGATYTTSASATPSTSYLASTLK